ncbi:Aste57867_9109 [Aphanomyces stellatus]|uniref:Aste57867_9109 protein n=1 Tax=Aphanomyces stellatus TaxID=120398 RepID=A0A485KM40_9STRA|nr:hypothetical protein As57867_009073 [Aphanomyces stellatus]VFT85993.1 Aste57867_9109 [Aphanomyces stellatus]
MPKLNEAIRLAEASNWAGLQDLVAASPAVARECDDYGMLPIHWASTDSSAPLPLLQHLVQAYPEGVQVPNKAKLLPLHIAIRAKVPLPTLRLLLDAFPESVRVETPAGLSPIALATQSRLSHAALDVLRAVERKVLPTDNALVQKNAIKSPTLTRPHSWHTISQRSSTPHAAAFSPKAPPAPLELSYDQSDGNNSSEESNNIDEDEHRRLRHPSESPRPWLLVDWCCVCRAPFTMFKPRHHCRHCGISICSTHSAAKKVPLAGFATPQRTCVGCYAALHGLDPAADAPSSRAPKLDVSQSRRQDKLFKSLVSPHTYEKSEVDGLRHRVADLTKQMDALQMSNAQLQQQVLEQEEMKAETLLLITDVMTRVSVLELQQDKGRQSVDFDL